MSRIDATPRPAARLPLAPAVAAAPQAPRDGDAARLRQTAQQLESVFVEQLYKAMRATIPQEEGIVSGGSGEEMFTGLMDQRLAADTPTQWERGLADAIYRQLRSRLPGAATEAPPATDPAEPTRALPSPSDPSGR